MDAISHSLERLGIGHIDLYQIHHSDSVTPVEETLRALDDLIRQGMVRYIGVSNWEAWKMMKAQGIADKRGWTRIETNQAYYSLAGRDIERDVVPAMKDQEMGLLVWSPLAGGYMSGKYSPGGEGGSEGRRAKNFDFPPVDKPKADMVIAAMRGIAKSHGVSVARIALAWVLAKPFVTSVIIGARTVEQLGDNIEAAKLVLSESEIAKLDELSALSVEYPHWMIARNNATRVPAAK